MMERIEWRSFMVATWQVLGDRKARLSSKRLGEDAGRSVPPLGLDTYVFSRLRRKATALAQRWLCAPELASFDVGRSTTRS